MNEIFNDGIPVTSLSRCCICKRNSLLLLEIFLRSSSSSSMPYAISPPLLANAGGFSNKVVMIFSLINEQGFSCSESLSVHVSDVCLVFSFTSSMLCNPFASCNTSRGAIFRNGIFATMRSMSPICLIKCVKVFFRSCSRIKYSVVLNRSSILRISCNGNISHRLIMREPIGDTVLSSTFSKVFPFSRLLSSNSRFCMVNRSIHKKSLRVIRCIELICPSC